MSETKFRDFWQKQITDIRKHSSARKHTGSLCHCHSEKDTRYHFIEDE